MRQRLSAVLYGGSFLLCWFSHALVCMGEGLPKVTPLSVDETLGLVFIIPEEGFPWHAYQHANPDAKATLCKMLASRKVEKYHGNVWRALGVIGDAEDVAEIESAVKAYKGLLKPHERDAIRGMFECLGMMSLRGVEEADRLVERMAKLQYWHEAGFQWFPFEVVQKHPEGRYEHLSWLLFGYGIAGKQEKLEQMVQTLLAAIPDPGARSGMKARNNPERLIGGYAGGIRSTLIGSKRLASGLRRECARSYRAHEPVLIEIQAEKLDDREAALVRDVVGEAHAAFEAMRSAILGGNHEAMRDRLLDNGEIPDAKKYERLWPEYLKDIRLEQSVFEALAEIDAGACDYRVERHVTYRSPSVPAQGGAPVAAIRCEEMRVAFTLRNTAEIAQRFRLSSEYTLAADGSLVVLMRKINGKWYWNPFGW